MTTTPSTAITPASPPAAIVPMSYNVKSAATPKSLQVWDSFMNKVQMVSRWLPFTIDSKSTYSAVIIEPRYHPHLIQVISNVMFYLGPGFGLDIFCSTENKQFLESRIEYLRWPRDIRLHLLPKTNLLLKDYNDLVLGKWFYECLTKNNVRRIVMFQTDVLLRKNTIAEFKNYDYIGAPWQNGTFGNGGLCVRSIDACLYAIRHVGFTPGLDNEDTYFSKQIQAVSSNVPTLKIASKFSIETTFNNYSMGAHGIAKYHCDINVAEFLESIKYSVITCPPFSGTQKDLLLKLYDFVVKNHAFLPRLLNFNLGLGTDFTSFCEQIINSYFGFDRFKLISAATDTAAGTVTSKGNENQTNAASAALNVLLIHDPTDYEIFKRLHKLWRHPQTTLLVCCDSTDVVKYREHSDIQIQFGDYKDEYFTVRQFKYMVQLLSEQQIKFKTIRFFTIASVLLIDDADSDSGSGSSKDISSGSGSVSSKDISSSNYIGVKTNFYTESKTDLRKSFGITNPNFIHFPMILNGASLDILNNNIKTLPDRLENNFLDRFLGYILDALSKKGGFKIEPFNNAYITNRLRLDDMALIRTRKSSVVSGITTTDTANALLKCL